MLSYSCVITAPYPQTALIPDTDANPSPHRINPHWTTPTYPYVHPCIPTHTPLHSMITSPYVHLHTPTRTCIPLFAAHTPSSGKPESTGVPGHVHGKLTRATIWVNLKTLNLSSGRRRDARRGASIQEALRGRRLRRRSPPASHGYRC